MGRVDLRLLLLLVVIPATIGSFAFAILRIDAVQDRSRNVRILSTWPQLVRQYLEFRAPCFPLIAAAALPGGLQATNRIDWASFQSASDWYWPFDGGAFRCTDDSEIARLIPGQANLVIYEDIAAREIVILRAPAKAGDAYEELAALRAPLTALGHRGHGA